MSWIAAALELIGCILLGYKKPVGWLFFVACGLLWIYVGLMNPGARGLVLICSVLIPVNILNYHKWRQGGKEKRWIG